MGMMKDIFFEIQELIETSQLSFQEISETVGVTLDMVYDVAQELGEFDE
jgi:predicted XRE-type DNA-binding protein